MLNFYVNDISPKTFFYNHHEQDETPTFINNKIYQSVIDVTIQNFNVEKYKKRVQKKLYQINLSKKFVTKLNKFKNQYKYRKELEKGKILKKRKSFCDNFLGSLDKSNQIFLAFLNSALEAKPEKWRSFYELIDTIPRHKKPEPPTKVLFSLDEFLSFIQTLPQIDFLNDCLRLIQLPFRLNFVTRGYPSDLLIMGLYALDDFLYIHSELTISNEDKEYLLLFFLIICCKAVHDGTIYYRHFLSIAINYPEEKLLDFMRAESIFITLIDLSSITAYETTFTPALTRSLEEWFLTRWDFQSFEQVCLTVNDLRCNFLSDPNIML